MITECLFNNIQGGILKEISYAKQSIYVVVAWFTDHVLFEALHKKSISGCKVYVITSNDEINNYSKIDYEKYHNENFKVFLHGSSDRNLIHHKFCIIDKKTIINGSYNWTNKAKSNVENIVITKGDIALANQFINEFYRLLDFHEPQINIGNFNKDLPKIIKRLEVIKNIILLEETHLITSILAELSKYSDNKLIQGIISQIDKQNYTSAFRLIQNFLDNYSSNNHTNWSNEDVASIKLEIRSLKNQIIALDNEKTDLEKTLTDFQYQHNLNLGDLILEILEFRKERYKEDKDKYEEAVKDEKEYKGQYNIEKEFQKLDKEQKIELKKKYRKATFLCHPDKFENEDSEMKKQAEEFLKELSDANSKNDINKVSQILEDLENGILTNNNKEIDDKEKLLYTHSRLNDSLNSIIEEIQVIKQSEVYRTVTQIEDWDSYFHETRKQLIQELDNLKNN